MKQGGKHVTDRLLSLLAQGKYRLVHTNVSYKVPLRESEIFFTVFPTTPSSSSRRTRAV